MKELTKSYGDLLQDKRVRSEQAKYESFTRQRNSVLSRYRKVYQAFNDLIAGLMRAQSFYSEMKDTVASLDKNVETFVNNRRAEGGQLLSQIESNKARNAGGQADRERDRLRGLMERMTVDPMSSPTRSKSSASRPAPLSRSSQANTSGAYKSPPISPPYPVKPPAHLFNMPFSQSPATGYQGYPSHPSNGTHHEQPQCESYPSAYDPMQYPYQNSTSPPPTQPMYPPNTHHPPYPQHSQHLPQGYVPPPPPPGPPPGIQSGYMYGQQSPPTRGQGGNGGKQISGPSDPWAGLSAWK